MFKLILYTYYVPKNVKSEISLHSSKQCKISYIQIQALINEPLLVKVMEEFTELHRKPQRVQSSLPSFGWH